MGFLWDGAWDALGQTCFSTPSPIRPPVVLQCSGRPNDCICAIKRLRSSRLAVSFRKRAHRSLLWPGPCTRDPDTVCRIETKEMFHPKSNEDLKNSSMQLQANVIPPPASPADQLLQWMWACRLGHKGTLVEVFPSKLQRITYFARTVLLIATI